MTYGNYPDLSSVRKILVIKMRHHGDVLLTSPVFSILQRAVPHATIDAFLYQETLPLLEGHPAISHFFLYDRKWKTKNLWHKYRQEAALLWKIRSASYDLVLNLTEGDRGGIAALVSGARYRIGQEPASRSYTHTVKMGPHPRHTIEKQLDFLRCAGIFPTQEERELFLHIPTAVHQKIQTLLSFPYIVIHPASRWRFKCLSTSQMGKIVKELHARGHEIVFSAGPDPIECAMVDEIIALNPLIPVHNLAGKLSIKELCALIANAQALLCVDSLPLHIASTTKTPVVALFGPTSELNWGPWRHPQARVITANLPCRPCYKDGCGGSKMSDCLFSLSPSAIVEAMDAICPSTSAVF
jgi:heptosyltransferase-3